MPMLEVLDVSADSQFTKESTRKNGAEVADIHRHDG